MADTTVEQNVQSTVWPLVSTTAIKHLANLNNMKKIKIYQVLYAIGIIGIMNTTTKVLFPSFNFGGGLFSYLFALPFTITGLIDYATGPLFFLWVFDGAPFWLIVAFCMQQEIKNSNLKDKTVTYKIAKWLLITISVLFILLAVWGMTNFIKNV